MLALVILSMILVEWSGVVRRHYETQRETAAGSVLAQFGVGLRGYIANVQGGTQDLPNDPYTVTGFDWLKAPTCGGPATNPQAGYVPCSFTGGEFGKDYSTTITQTPTTNAIDARTSFDVLPPAATNRTLAAARATGIAHAAMAQQDAVANNLFVQVFANTPVTATAPTPPDQIQQVDRGRVLLVADNAPSNDIWLRVDGTNKMLANLNVGGHDLINAANGTFAGTVQASNLEVGQHADVTGNLRVHGQGEIDDGLTVAGSTLTATKGVVAGDVYNQGVGKYGSQAIYDAGAYTGQWSYDVPMPNCTNADGAANGGTPLRTPLIYTAIQNTGPPLNTNHTQDSGGALYAVNLLVQARSGYWLVTPRISQVDYSITSSTSGSTINVDLHKNVTQVVGDPNVQFIALTKCE